MRKCFGREHANGSCFRARGNASACHRGSCFCLNLNWWGLPLAGLGNMIVRGLSLRKPGRESVWVLGHKIISQIMNIVFLEEKALGQRSEVVFQPADYFQHVERINT